ncbi:hypothetical protein KFE25_011608 [Diacronema lutheri]|uniref:Glutaredoxin domain-containing protein n=2 Tax=Diacronema lutheri TaxID=2081491 RepID=A0A8J6CC50_DIALT|nr:hypothetical protein KFE25_011608 [Diacronema lutheri]
MAVVMRARLALALLGVAGCAALHPTGASRLVASRAVPRASRARMELAQAGAGDANERIGEMIGSNKIMVFMKGSKLMPQCGFSNAVVQVFNSLKVPYATFDVLSDPDIRQGIKEYSSWPTIPQVYVDGEFIGGCDIVVEMYQKGELQELAARVSAE